MAEGKVLRVIGPVVDLEFPAEQLPEIMNAVELWVDESGSEKLVVEVQLHLGNNWVRCVSMGPTEGLRRG
ncbi:MAG TPA: F0F1 ATP synthase subunit beta, partial [Chloroflexota bacterium]|nr:F0F1 ATP synthase subunit beta [Chloroflexota bacterium]